ncbi:MAG: hypothetical protein ACRDL7_15040, partial [Gaiellaceae bacterium]
MRTRRAGGHLTQDNRQPRQEVLASGSRHPSGGNLSSRSDAPLPGRKETRRYTCPACGRNTLEFTRGPLRDGGTGVLLHCWDCGGGLDAVSTASGIPRYKLLTWPPPEGLGPPVGTETIVPGIRPSEGTVGGCVSALWSQEHEEARAYLSVVRGLT